MINSEFSKFIIIIVLSISSSTHAISQNNIEKAYNKGRSLYLSRKYSDCIPYLKKVIGNNEDEEVFYMLGCAEYESGNFNESLIYFNKCLEFNSPGNDYLYARGYVNIKLRNFAEAIDDLKKSAETPSRNQAERYVTIGDVYLMSGDSLSAIQSYRSALMINPLIKYANGNLAQIYLGKDSLELALYHANEEFRFVGEKRKISSELDINIRYSDSFDVDSMNYLTLGAIYEKLEDYRSAVVNYGKLKDASFISSYDLVKIGWCYLNLGVLDSAKLYLWKGRELQRHLHIITISCLSSIWNKGIGNLELNILTMQKI